MAKMREVYVIKPLGSLSVTDLVIALANRTSDFENIWLMSGLR